jgi:hypothetical protein
MWFGHKITGLMFGNTAQLVQDSADFCQTVGILFLHWLQLVFYWHNDLFVRSMGYKLLEQRIKICF